MFRDCDITKAGCFKRLTFLAIFFLVASFSISAQKTREEKPPLRERMVYGGSVGLQFGTYTDIHVAPIVGLWIRPRIEIGAGPNFTYFKGPDYNGYDNETSMYGGNAYAEFVLIRDINNGLPIGIHLGIFLHLEDEMLSLESAYWSPRNPSTRFMVNTVLGGFGISQQMGVRSSLNIMFLWTLTDSGYAIYNNPEIRLSFRF